MKTLVYSNPYSSQMHLPTHLLLLERTVIELTFLNKDVYTMVSNHEIWLVDKFKINPNKCNVISKYVHGKITHG